MVFQGLVNERNFNRLKVRVIKVRLFQRDFKLRVIS